MSIKAKRRSILSRLWGKVDRLRASEGMERDRVSESIKGIRVRVSVKGVEEVCVAFLTLTRTLRRNTYSDTLNRPT